MTDMHRTNIYLYSADVDWMVQYIGYGWSETVRELVHEHVKAKRKELQQTQARTVGDIFDV